MTSDEAEDDDEAEDEAEDDEAEEEEGSASSPYSNLVVADTASSLSSPSQTAQRRERDYKRQVSVLERRFNAVTRLLTNTKVALACSNAELMSHGIVIPETAKMVGGEATNGAVGIGSGDLQRTLSISCAETNVNPNECPYRMEVIGMPDTTVTTSDTKFKESFPHGMLNFTKTGEFAAHVEQRRPISIQAKLMHRHNAKIACDERDLKPGLASPRIPFRLWLLTEAGEHVIFEDLEESAKRIKTLTEPNIIGASVTMQNGTVTFNIRELKVYSSHTKHPKSQKFKFKIECVDKHLNHYDHMHTETISFYSVSRIRIKE